VSAPPMQISHQALATATGLICDYYLTMAERVYCDSTSMSGDCRAATLARWIISHRPIEVHIRHLQRDIRLPGLRTAGQIREAAEKLVDAGWLRPPLPNRRFGPRARFAYMVNPLCLTGHLQPPQTRFALS
jgi:hypothetical protein